MIRSIPCSRKTLMLLTFFALSLSLVTAHDGIHDNTDSETIMENHGKFVEYFDTSGDNIMNNSEVLDIIDAFYDDRSLDGKELTKADINASISLYNREYQWDDPRTSEKIVKNYKTVLTEFDDGNNIFEKDEINSLVQSYLENETVAGEMLDSRDIEAAETLWKREYQWKDRPPKAVLTMPETAETGEEVTISSLNSEDPEGGKITDSLAYATRTSDGDSMTFWNVEGKGSATKKFRTPGTYNVTLRVWNQEDLKDSVNRQITIEEPEKEPEGSLKLASDAYSPGAEATANYKISVEGEYSIRWAVDGEVVDETSLGKTSGNGKATHQIERKGTLEARLVALGSWWNPLDSDRIVDRSSSDVKELPRESYTHVEKNSEPHYYSRDNHGYTIEPHAKLIIYMNSDQIDLPENYDNLYLSVDTGYFSDGADIWFSTRVQEKTPNGWKTVWSKGTNVGPSTSYNIDAKKKVDVNEGTTYRVVAKSGGQGPFIGGKQVLQFPKFIAHQREGSGSFTVKEKSFSKETEYLTTGLRNTFRIKIYNNQIQRDKPEKVEYYIGEEGPDNHLMNAFNTMIPPSSSVEYRANIGNDELRKVLDGVDSGEKEIYVKFGHEDLAEARKIGKATVLNPGEAVITDVSIDGSLEPGSMNTIEAQGKIFSGDSHPKIVIGSKDRKNVYGELVHITRSGEDFQTNQGVEAVEIPESCSDEIIAAGITDSEDAKQAFKQGEGIGKKIGACNASSSYTKIDYEKGSTATINDRTLLQFENHSLYVEEVGESDGYMDWGAGTEKGRTDIASSIDEGGSTTHMFGGTNYAIGVCSTSEDSARIVIEGESRVQEKWESSKKEWPEAWCSDTQEVEDNQEENQTTETGDDEQTTETDDGTDESEETAVSDLKLDKESFSPGDTVKVEVEISESLASSGYFVRIEDSNGQTLKKVGGETTQKTISFQGEKPGQYTAILEPSGVIGKLKGALTGSSSYDTEEFTVKSSEVAWKNYCNQKGYNTENIQQQINCIKKDIVPDYFQDSAGEQPEVAESLCSDLLNYKYSQEEKSCVG